MKKPLYDPFESVVWALEAQVTPQEVLADIFNNHTITFLKTIVHIAFRSVMLNIPVKEFQHRDLFRAYLRINSLILVGAYFYKKHKKRLKKEESAIDNTTWQQDNKASKNGYLQFYAEPQYRIFCLFELDLVAYWKADWAYFIQAAMRPSKFYDTESYPSLNYFIHTLIDAMYEIHQSS